MARYDVAPAIFRTPKGVPVRVFLRDETNDWNTAYSALNEDEYRLAGRDLSGLALDIGGHIGTVTLALAVDNPTLRVIVLEPIPENLVLLRDNLAANAVADRVTVVEGMAGKSGRGQIRYAFKGNETALHHAYIGNSTLAVPEGDHTIIDVPSYSLGDLIGDQEVTALKIDAEGGEYAFLGSSLDSLAQCALIYGEWHPNAPEGNNRTQGDILTLLSPTHEVTFSGPIGGPGGFVAVRR